MTHKRQRILVTGGAGFIGSHLVDRLLNEGFEVSVIDNLDTGRLENIVHHQGREEFHFVKGDIRDFNLVKETIKDVDVVFHEAALASVTLSVENPILTNDINVTGTLTLLKASSDLHIKRFIYASSAAVYGDTPSPQKRENMNLNPTSPYGVSKLAAENYVKIFHKLYGLETVSLRYFNVYGPRQRFDIQCAYGGAITIFTNRLLKNMPPIIYGDGEQTRDFVYIQDVVEANMLALNSKKAAGEVFNIGTGTNISVNQVVEILKEIMNKKNLKNVHADPRPTDIRHGYADISKAKKILGYDPKFSIEEGLTKLVKWYVKNSK
ncbi:MAG: SDR family oxidoreductase [Candidatus Bathyarchaeota archaeon]|nr:SDR family oxidoreductase [Candidatus Bathyarchaeota archaeon]MDH5595119.1 SDR family oxidoreductase [Candidatus Bathyarchaeota archaeon]